MPTHNFRYQNLEIPETLHSETLAYFLPCPGKTTQAFLLISHSVLSVVRFDRMLVAHLRIGMGLHQIPELVTVTPVT